MDPDWPISRHILVEALDAKYKEENKILRVSRKKVESGQTSPQHTKINKEKSIFKLDLSMSQGFYIQPTYN